MRMMNREETFDFLEEVYANCPPADPWWTRLPQFGLDEQGGRAFLDAVGNHMDEIESSSPAEIVLERAG